MLVFALLVLGAEPTAATGIVSGLARQTPSICKGGVAITDEDYAALPPPTPIAGLVLHVRGGAKITHGAPIAKVTTNTKGRFTVALPHGTWCFYSAERALRGAATPLAAPSEPHIDAQCLAEERTRCDLVVRVNGDRKGLLIERPEQCPQSWARPCYRGPMPP